MLRVFKRDARSRLGYHDKLDNLDNNSLQMIEDSMGANSFNTLDALQMGALSPRVQTSSPMFTPSTGTRPLGALTPMTSILADSSKRPKSNRIVAPLRLD